MAKRYIVTVEEDQSIPEEGPMPLPSIEEQLDAAALSLEDEPRPPVPDEPEPIEWAKVAAVGVLLLLGGSLAGLVIYVVHLHNESVARGVALERCQDPTELYREPCANVTDCTARCVARIGVSS